MIKTFFKYFTAFIFFTIALNIVLLIAGIILRAI